MEKEIKVEQPTLIHFIEKVVELARQGYVPSKTNQGAPQSWGLGLFTCGMVLEDSEPKTETKVSEPVEKTVEPESNVSDEEAKTEAPETTEYVKEPIKKTTTRRRKTSSKSKTSE